MPKPSKTARSRSTADETVGTSAARTNRTTATVGETKAGAKTPRPTAPQNRRAAKPKLPAAASRAGRRGGKAAADAAPPTPTGIRAGTRLAHLIDLLRRPGGATVSEIATALGWQLHSVRGAISGSIRKKLGLAVTSEKVEDRGRVYRIPAEA